MHTQLFSIERICGSIVGLKSLIFTEMSNVIGIGAGFYPPAPGSGFSFLDVDKIYSLSYEKYSASYNLASAVDSGGDYAVATATCHVPRGRLEVETLMQRLRNRPLLVIAIDKYDNQYYMYDARRAFTFTTGDAGPAKNGYNITFRAVCDYLFPGMSGSGDIDTAPPPPGGGSGGEEVCCVSIAPLTIAYTPAPTGNTLNLSQLVTTQNGSVYFIDYTGRSVILNRPAPLTFFEQMPEGSAATFITVPAGFPLPDPDDYAAPTYDPNAEISRRLWVKLGSRWLEYEHGEGFYIDHALGRIHFYTSIDGALIRVYSYEGIPAIPV